MIAFTWHGKPLPKGRPRVVNGRAHTPKATRDYEAAIVRGMSGCAHVKSGDVGVTIELRFANGTHGDLDNCAKAILDAAQGCLFPNDKAVRQLHVWRTWATDDAPEGFTMVVTPLPDMPRPKRPRKRKGAA